MLSGIGEHPGMESMAFCPVTRSVLARFNPHEISRQEILLRIALHLSLDYDAVPVRLLAEPERPRALGPAAALSGVAVAASLAIRALGGPGKPPGGWDWAAGVGTAWAVLDHARNELRHRGTFDPEVLSLAYLLAAFWRRDVLAASAVTWLASFGRHLVELPPSGVEVRPLAIKGHGGGQSRFEVLIGPDVDAPPRVSAATALQGLLKYAMTGGGAHSFHTLLDDLREVAKVHGEVLEGFGRLRPGIPIRFH
jgi:hypothetical protein